ncbi:hypothetical protein [Paenibacillus tengchongensis]|uniref:hypothetical protein n=1 Tax=Paenibacillus tengchongensis TaxID=2608684 RepID=UPI00124E7B61|nr:hypothetical protein [Paenibacillus tengchongensis]
MEPTVQLLKDWLEAQVGATLVITKQELEDKDIVHFHLETVEFRDAESTLDDYLDSALILKGSGNTMNADGDLVPLPQSTYEIAVEGLKVVSSSEHGAELKSERAKYTLSVD